jgi:peptidoglycan/xylan/chitin deacetylase (PgdA/CDA1 family)
LKAILTYHSIDASESAISTDQATFRRHIDWIVARGVRVVTPAELTRLPADEEALALTFDDGFQNFATAAWPLLRAHGLSATLFVATEWVGRTNGWGRLPGVDVPELPLLTWDGLGRMAEDGLNLGAHSRTHPDLRQVDGTRLADEVVGSAELIRERTGAQPHTFAYPYGEHDGRVLGVVRTAYEAACTTELRVFGDAEDAHRLPRLDAFYLRRAGRMETWGTRSFKRYIALRNRMRLVRRILTKGVGR